MSSENEKPQKTCIFKNYLEFVDSPGFFTTPFSWLYLIAAVAFLALPVLILLQGIDLGIFERYDGQFYLGSKIVIAFILSVAAAAAAAIISFIVAWNGRKNEKTEKLNINFIIDVCADLQALIIKALAHFIAVFGFFIGLFALIFGNELLRGVNFNPYFNPVILMISAVIFGYGLVWFSKLYKFVIAWVSKVIVKVIVQIFKFVVLHAIGTIYNFIAHVLRQLFDYVFVLIQSLVDLTVNGLRVIIALIARLGRFLLAYSRSPFKNPDYNNAKITYNE